MKATLIKLLTPPLYFVEKNSFLGDIVTRINTYRVGTDIIAYNDPATGIDVILKMSQVYLFERNAKKEAAKSIIPVSEGNLALLKELEAKGVKLTNYQRQQVIEDGEASEVYQENK